MDAKNVDIFKDVRQIAGEKIQMRRILMLNYYFKECQKIVFLLVSMMQNFVIKDRQT